MEPSSLIRAVAAFVAGVVVALGSALIYVRVSETVHPQPVAQRTLIPSEPLPAELPDAGQNSAEQAAPAARPAPDNQPTPPEPVQHANKRKVMVDAHRQSTKPAPRHDEPTHRTLEIAQNRLPAHPLITVPARAVAPAPVAPVVGESPQQQEAPAQLPAAESAPEPQPQYTPPPVPVRQPHVVTLQAGTSVIVRLAETLSTDHNYTGDTFRATLESRIVMDGFIIADKGSKVLGRIAKAQRAARIDGGSDLTLTLTEINTTDSQRVRIDTTSYDKRGPSSADTDTAEIAGGAALGAIVGAVAAGGKGAAIGAGAGAAIGTGTVLATRGKPAVLPIETRLTFRLATPVTITEKLNY